MEGYFSSVCGYFTIGRGAKNSSLFTSISAHQNRTQSENTTHIIYSDSLNYYYYVSKRELKKEINIQLLGD